MTGPKPRRCCYTGRRGFPALSLRGQPHKSDARPPAGTPCRREAVMGAVLTFPGPVQDKWRVFWLCPEHRDVYVEQLRGYAVECSTATYTVGFKTVPV